jgi:hypothetical protein
MPRDGEGGLAARLTGYYAAIMAHLVGHQGGSPEQNMSQSSQRAPKPISRHIQTSTSSRARALWFRSIKPTSFSRRVVDFHVGKHARRRHFLGVAEQGTPNPELSRQPKSSSRNHPNAVQESVERYNYAPTRHSDGSMSDSHKVYYGI